jgi:hypothetical protein
MGYLVHLQPCSLNWIDVVGYGGRHDLGQRLILEHSVGGGLDGDGINVCMGRPEWWWRVRRPFPFLGRKRQLPSGSLRCL